MSLIQQQVRSSVVWIEQIVCNCCSGWNNEFIVPCPGFSHTLTFMELSLYNYCRHSHWNRMCFRCPSRDKQTTEFTTFIHKSNVRSSLFQVQTQAEGGQHPSPRYDHNRVMSFVFVQLQLFLLLSYFSQCNKRAKYLSLKSVRFF